ncbi:MAG: zinc-dependent peptidase [Bacteroidota bacterium]
MEQLQGPNPLPAILIFLFFGAALIYYFLVYINSSFVKMYLSRFLFMRNLQKIYQPHLIRNFPFYNALSDRNKLIFERRVQKFIDMKQFIPRGIGEITPEMKTLIAGSAIQLTFGYSSIYFRHFWRILVYPDEYYSNITKKYHKGEVNLGGIIVISWKSFKEGFRSHADGNHLGFHEMAHALRLINIVENPEYDFYDRRIMQAFDVEATREMENIRQSNGNMSPFREYGGTNKDEFFAVAVEVFFEQPTHFRDHNPRLYTLLAMILKIDPIEVTRTGEMKR